MRQGGLGEATLPQPRLKIFLYGTAYMRRIAYLFPQPMHYFEREIPNYGIQVKEFRINGKLNFLRID